MLKLYENFQNVNVMSLRVGRPIARVLKPIINPNNLYIEGWFVQDSHSSETLVLVSQDVRDIMAQGLVVNDHEVLSDPEDLVRLKKVLEIKFELLRLAVVSQNGKKYGKVSDFAFETSNSYVQKIYVAQPLLRSFTGGTLSIDRSQIIEITNRRIIIEDPTVKADAKAPATSPVVG